MINHIIIKLRRMIKQNITLLGLVFVLGSQSETTMAYGGWFGWKATPAKKITGPTNKQQSSKKLVDGDLPEGQVTVEGEPDEQRPSTRPRNVTTRVVPGNVQQAQAAHQGATSSLAFAKNAASAITEPFVNALQYVDSSVGLSKACSTYLVQPVQSAWLKARKLQLDEYNNVRRKSETGELDFDMSADQAERGLLNQKIDNIVNSVINMYRNNASFEQIGKFVSNSVELILVTPVVGAGAGAGMMIGGAGGALYGAAVGVGEGFKYVPRVIVVGSGPGILPVAAGAAFAGPMIGAAGYGTYKGVVGAYKGAGAGADFTSKFIQSPRKAMGYKDSTPSQNQ